MTERERLQSLFGDRLASIERQIRHHQNRIEQLQEEYFQALMDWARACQHAEVYIDPEDNTRICRACGAERWDGVWYMANPYTSTYRTVP